MNTAIYLEPGRKIAGLLLSSAVLASCASSPPRSVADVCEIFEDRRSWYSAAKASQQRWGIPIAVNMSFILLAVVGNWINPGGSVYCPERFL
ncbi:MAG: hypothetical protein EXR84_12260 [Gammaproteobacteria bacterium]|nr:hypothetical protein [Gammaproteobacteria bacterium]